MTSRDSRVRLVAGLVVAAYIAIVAVWSFVIPLGGGIDEPRHLRYVQVIAEEGRLPTPAEKQEAISHHPPLHYLILAPIYLATRGMGDQAAWHVLRFASIVMGVGTVILVFATLRRLLPQRPWAAVAGMAFLALLPHFQMISGFLSNDASVTLFITLMLYCTVRAIREPQRALIWSAAAGLAGGAATAAKMNGLIPIPAALLVVGISAYLSKPKPELRDTSRALPNMGGFAGTFLITGGVAIGRQLLVWGTLESDPAWPERLWPVHTFAEKLARAVEGLYRSTWAQPGWLPGPHSSPPLAPTDLWPRPDIETTLLALMLPFTLIGLIGTVLLCIRWLRSAQDRAKGLGGALLVAVSLLAYAAVAYRAIYVHPGSHEAARYALQSVAGVVGMLSVGPLILPRRWTVVCWVCIAVLLAAMVAVSFWEMHTYLIPTFAP
ncbi:MAG: ArnT family glycosyltransferase [Armatimonadota bacterium]